MTRFKQWLAIPLLVGFSALSNEAKQATAQASEARIHDPTHLLGRDQDAQLHISRQIQALEEDHGFQVHLVIEPSFIGTTVEEQANELRQAWIADGNGLVVVFESDSRRLGIGQNMRGDPDPKDLPYPVMPAHETNAIVNRALTATDHTQASEIYLESVMENLLTGFEAYFDRLETPPPPERSVRTALLMIGGFSLLGLTLIGAGGLVRHSSISRGRHFRFPVVDRPERLGAPCGGSVTARRFAPPRNTPAAGN